MKLAMLVLFSILTIRTLDYMLLDDDKKPPPPCSGSKARQFDFWLGDWELSWTDKDGNAKRGTNKVSRLFGDCNIKEEFSDAKGEFKGTSVSTYVPSEQKWKQTWVDNNGAYLDFVGEYKDGKMILSRKEQRDGKGFLQRMIFYDIAKNSLSWNWERSDDNGKTWTVVWKISYSRKGKA